MWLRIRRSPPSRTTSIRTPASGGAVRRTTMRRGGQGRICYRELPPGPIHTPESSLWLTAVGAGGWAAWRAALPVLAMRREARPARQD